MISNKTVLITYIRILDSSGKGIMIIDGINCRKSTICRSGMYLGMEIAFFACCVSLPWDELKDAALLLTKQGKSTNRWRTIDGDRIVSIGGTCHWAHG